MARVPEQEIERIKREIAVERLAAAKGVQLKRHGKDLAGLMEVSAEGTSATSTLRGTEDDFAGGGRGVVGPWSGGGRGAESSTEARENGFHLDVEGADPKNARWGSSGANATPYVNEVTPTAAAR
jgi:hypothetical protein